jgi:hypothetical protein
MRMGRIRFGQSPINDGDTVSYDTMVNQPNMITNVVFGMQRTLGTGHNPNK